MFARYVGIDYSGADTPTSRQSGLRAFEATPATSPTQVRGPGGKNWSRSALAWWLDAELSKPGPTIVGIDHAFSLPAPYMKRHALTQWDAFLDDFVTYWPTHANDVESLRTPGGVTNPRSGSPNEYRLTDAWTGAAKSVFLFDVQGSVAKSTHAGIPWVRSLRRARPKIHFWPFDGWMPPSGASVVLEIYPSLFRRRYTTVANETADEHDARCVCTWLRERDGLGLLHHYFHPHLTPTEQAAAELEGWIFGVL